MANFMKSMSGAAEAKMEQLKQLTEEGVKFTQNVADLAEKSSGVVVELVSLVATVGGMVASGSIDIAGLQEARASFRESVTELRKEIEEDLQSNLDKSKEIMGMPQDEDISKKKGKLDKAEQIILKIATIIDVALNFSVQFLTAIEILDKIITAVEEGRLEDIVPLSIELKECLENAKEGIQEMKDISSGNKKSKDKAIDNKENEKKKDKAIDNKENEKKKEKGEKNKSEKNKEDMGTSQQSDDEEESGFWSRCCCCCKKSSS